LKPLGCFSEMNVYSDTGSIEKCIVSHVDYDKEKVIEYLMSGKRIAGCPKNVIDCVTVEKISDSFSVYSDGEYDWCDFLIYHIRKYNIVLPVDFINKIGA